MDLQRMLKSLVDMVIQSNAEMAFEQQKALSINTHGTKSQLESLNSLAVETEGTMAEVRQSMVSNALIKLSIISNNSQLLLIPVIQSLSERQDALDQVKPSSPSEAIY
jgi:hypothetical protein